jgi:DNA-binding CsgD family transcriptional regulator
VLPIDIEPTPHQPDRAEVWARVKRLVTESFGSDALLMVGESGIGKSFLWSRGVTTARASGACVLATIAAEAESSMSYVVLGDLLKPVVDHVIGELPAPQREALEIALLRSPAADRPPSVRLVAMALQTVLSRCIGQSCLIVAIDDVQWVDPESQAVLAFALRRSGDMPIRALMTMHASGPVDWSKDTSATTSPLLDVFRAEQWATLSPLTPSAVRTLIRERLGMTFSLGDSELIHAATMGNPAWAIELAGAWAREQRRPGAPTPTPSSLQAMMSKRISALDPEVIDALCVVSAMGRPTLQAATRALEGLVSDPAQVLDQAIAQGVVDEIDAGLLSARPPLSAAAMKVVPLRQQQELFGRLVEVAESPEAKAHYLARTVDESTPDEVRNQVAAAFDEIVNHARSRGAIAHAARLAEQALHISAPGAPELDRRRIVAARLHTESANFNRAVEMLTDIDFTALETPLLEQALPMGAALHYLLSGPDDARVLVEHAASKHDPDPRRLSLLHTLLADRFYGDFANRRHHARQALHHAEQVDPHGSRAYQACLQLIDVQVDEGDGVDGPLIERARNLEARLPRLTMPFSVDIYHARGLIITDELTAAQEVLRTALANARAVDDNLRIAVLCMSLAEAQLLAGDAIAAAGSLAESDEATEWAPGEPTHKTLLRGRLMLVDGCVDEVKGMVKELNWAGSPHRTRQMAAHYLLGMVASARDEHDRAVELLGKARDGAESFGHHDTGARFRLDTELGEQLVLAGRLDQARRIAQCLLVAGERGNRCTLRGIGHRISGLCMAAEGDLDTAYARLSAAVAEHQNSQLRSELGRSLLGRARLDIGRHRQHHAVADLHRAAAIFADGGFSSWHRVVRTELENAAAADPRAVLTAAERRVVDAVLTGATNRDAAHALHLGIRTVESHLAAAYRKLGIRSRQELRGMFPSARADMLSASAHNGPLIAVDRRAVVPADHRPNPVNVSGQGH